MEGDIVVRQGDLGGSSALDAPLANPDRLWPSGMVEYKYYDTFPAQKRKIMQKAMEYITRKVFLLHKYLGFCAVASNVYLYAYFWLSKSGEIRMNKHMNQTSVGFCFN